jgi:calcineurin-like phosphoesterase family protein
MIVVAPIFLTINLRQNMTNTFFASDHHFGHANILKFENYDGKPLRVFSSVEEMDEHMIAQHNSVVGHKDTCWFLGDVVINRRFLSHVQRLNGRKRLILGNHDIFKNKDYYNAGFEDLHSFRKFDGFVATHIPIHSDSINRWGVNVHGHTHANRVRTPYGVNANTGEIKYSDKPDLRYYCVCMEQLNNYTPVSIEEVRYNVTTS